MNVLGVLHQLTYSALHQIVRVPVNKSVIVRCAVARGVKEVECKLTPLWVIESARLGQVDSFGLAVRVSPSEAAPPLLDVVQALSRQLRGQSVNPARSGEE